MANKTIEQLEREYNIMTTQEKDLSKKVSEDEFKEIISSGKFVGVDFKQREKFLKDNGYKLTRENMINADLSVNPSKK